MPAPTALFSLHRASPWLAGAALAAGCAAVQPARMALPEGLAASTEQLPVQGLGGQRRGDFTVGNASGRFERRADQLSLFDAVSAHRGGARYTLKTPGAAEIEGQCQQREISAQSGVLALALRPYTVNCQWRDGARLTLEAEPRAARTQNGRQGVYEAVGVQLQLRSVHTLQGSALPLAVPAGYTFTHGGVVVGAVDLSDSTRPRLWRPPAGQPLHHAVTQAALALALLWEPAAEAR